MMKITVIEQAQMTMLIIKGITRGNDHHHSFCIALMVMPQKKFQTGMILTPDQSRQ
jgi:hypothetical protein